jgi:hypothetical protein
MQYKALALVGAALFSASSAAQAQKVASGQAGGLTWEAQSRIIGVGSTGTIASGGSPTYVAPMPKYSGVVALIMDYGPGGQFICTGSLLPDRRSILTAAHCVSDGAGTENPGKVTAFFYGGSDPDTIVANNPGVATAIDAIGISVNSSYTGQVIDQNDIAVVRLGADAPIWASSYEIDFSPIGNGDQFNVAGYGRRSDTGGNIGANLGTGRLRQGDNNYAFRFGDSDFGTFFTNNFFGSAQVSDSWVSDFDNGLAANDASCALAGAFNLGGSKYCNLGLGNIEVNVAGGDSGGPQFRNGKITSVTSYGLSFGVGFGDIRAGLNSSFGEFSGYVPLYLHADFIANAVPEPATWAMMIAGFGMVGAGLRSRRGKTSVSFA